MNSEIGQYGYEGTVQPSYYRIRQWNPMFSSYQIMLVRIDEFGNDEFVGYRSLADGERIEDVATLDEAKREHLAPALREAEANQKKWLENRPPPDERPEPEPMDKATERLFSDGGEIEYDDLQHRRRRG